MVEYSHRTIRNCNSLLLMTAKGIDMKRLSIATALMLVMSVPAFAQTVGLVQNSFSATYTSGDGAGCKSLLVTGQFIAATPGYQLTVKKVSPQSTPTIHELELIATPPTGGVPQVLTLLPVSYSDPNFTSCPYGVSIAYAKQKVIVGLMPASTAVEK